jgi:hypothetical protein
MIVEVMPPFRRRCRRMSACVGVRVVTALSETILRGGRCEHERVRVDATAGGTICTCWWIQRGPRGIQVG